MNPQKPLTFQDLLPKMNPAGGQDNSSLKPVTFQDLLPKTNMNTTSSLNPAGGQDMSTMASRQFGPDKGNISTGVFSGGNTHSGSPHMGAFASANANGHSLSVSKTIVPDVSATNNFGANANLFKNNQHALNANAFSSTTKMNNGFSFDQRGGGLNYNNAAGHGAAVGVTQIPGFGNSLDVAAKANIFQTPNTTFDVTANTKTHISGPFQGNTNYGFGAGFTHNF